MTDCTEDPKYKNTYRDLENLLKQADEYEIDRSKLPSGFSLVVEFDKTNKHIFKKVFDRIVNEVTAESQKELGEDELKEFDTYITSLKKGINCYLETAFSDSRGGGAKKTRQNKKTRQKRRKSSKRS